MMKPKILIIGLLVVLLVGGYVTIQPYLPGWSAKVMMNQLEKNDYEMILESDEYKLDGEQKALLKEMLSTLSYDIKGSRIEGEKAYVTMDLTFVDLQQLVLDNYQTIFSNASNNLGGLLKDLLDGGMQKVAINELLTLLEDETVETPLMTKEVDVLFERSGLLWKPVITKEWLQSAFGLDSTGGILEKLIQQR